MAARSVRRTPGERLLAWLYTGPFGRLYGTLADVVELWVRWMLRRARQRMARPRS